MRNIGLKTAEWLKAFGIDTYADLEQAGALNAFERLQARFPHKLTLNALWAMQAALLDLPWLELPVEIKQSLLQQMNERNK